MKADWLLIPFAIFVLLGLELNAAFYIPAIFLFIAMLDRVQDPDPQSDENPRLTEGLPRGFARRR